MGEGQRYESLTGRGVETATGPRSDTIIPTVGENSKVGGSAVENWTKRCGWCGSSNPQRALYCMDCGAAIDVSAIQSDAAGVSQRGGVAFTPKSLPLSAITWGIYFSVGAAAYLLILLWMVAIFREWVVLVPVVLEGLAFVYLACVGRYGRASLSKYLIMLVWAVTPLVLILPYYAGKTLIAYAVLDRVGMIRGSRVPPQKWHGLLYAIMPMIFIAGLALAAVVLWGQSGIETPANRWPEWVAWIKERWSLAVSGDLADRFRDSYQLTKDWVMRLPSRFR